MRDCTLIWPGRPLSRGIAAGALCVAALVAVPLATADAATKHLEPSTESRRALVFDLGAVRTEAVSDAYALIRARGRTSRQQIGADRVQSAPSKRLKVKKPRPTATGTLVVTTEDTSGPEVPGASGTGSTGGSGTGTSPTPEQAPAPPPATGGTEVFADNGSTLDPNPTWGSTDCASDSRHRAVNGYRELTVIDGDDFWGERCELGRNNHKDGPTAVYREGDHAITSASFRLPASYPLENTSWQVVMQMKQTQPSANGGGTPVLSLEAKGGRWRLLQSTSSGPSGDTRELWTAPAERGVWTRFAFDVNYSQDPSRGSVQVNVDLDGDGDTASAAERSPAISTYTLKRETEGGSATDGIAPGESIPSHLRVGIYHHPNISCPPPTGCAVEIDDVQIVDAA